MHKTILLLLILLLLSHKAKSQGYYWVAFTDKNNTTFSLSNPHEYLSDRAIQRRQKQNIPLDSLDLPVNLSYINSVFKLDAQLVHSSKWLNGITIKTETENFSSEAGKISFVKSVQFTKPLFPLKSGFIKFVESESHENAPIDTSIYGESVYQTGLLNGQYLHNQNYMGQGIDIAVLDAGFYNADSYPAFDSLWANGQILGVKDFVEPDSNIFVSDYHGMSVLSCMGGNVPERLIGTAAKSSFWLLRTEDSRTEYLIEEDNWVAAAEYADSVGVDIINSSLGYYQFDDSVMNHSYADMDGKTTRVTQAANIAATRGILVFSSAGNEGNKPWKYLIAPSDGDHVLGVGATNEFGIAANFTSFGPASDGDIKPNVSALGWSTFLQRSDGNLGYSNGTSFSSPVMAGMAACLWQANPDATAFEVKQAIEQSASLYSRPDSLLGYGIPDMRLADEFLGPSSIVEWSVNKNWQAYPNPVKDYIVLQQKDNQNIDEVYIEILSVDGRSVRKWKKQGSPIIVLNKLGFLPGGVLLLKISTNTTFETIKLFKYR